MGSTNSRMTLSVAFYCRLCTIYTVRRCRVWRLIIAHRQNKRSDDIERGFPSSPVDSTQRRTTSGVACHYHPWTAHTIRRRRAWNITVACGQNTRSNDVGPSMLSTPLGSTHSRTTPGVACQNSLWTTHTIEWYWRGNHHHLRTSKMDGGCGALHVIITFVQNTQSDDVGH